MSGREWAFLLLVWVPLSMAIGVAAGGLVVEAMGRDVIWWWEQ